MWVRWRVVMRCAALLLIVGLMGWVCAPGFRADLESFPTAGVVYDSDGDRIRVSVGPGDVYCETLNFEELGRWVPMALVAAEDKRFYSHPGVDPVAMCRAATRNLLSRRVVSGASTISTLVVKLTQPRSRNLGTKLIEAHHAIDLDSRMTKDGILTQYLNRAPFGGNVVGVEAASRHYFSKKPADLTLAESALLVGLPQSPSRYRPDRFLWRAKNRRHYVLTRMLAAGVISRSEFEQAEAEPVRLDPATVPFTAPHFCDLVQQRYPARREWHTTLNSDMQSEVERVLERQAQRFEHSGVLGASVVVLDVKTGAVRVLVGSPNFWSENAGQVNGAVVRRSPGSTLKPFVYAMAMDEGLCTPQTMVADIPRHYVGYRPRNFNLLFSGPVSTRRALWESLNIPAIEYCEKVGQENVIRQLRRLGLSSLDREASSYGLSVVTGGAEVRLLDLVNAYAVFAREGLYMDYTLLVDDVPMVGKRLFSPEACYLVADILSGDERAADIVGHNADVRRPRFAWKTGTSTGQRDAWSIGWNPDYVVGVWFGNMHNRSTSGLVGSKAASPVLGDVFGALYRNKSAPWFDRPENVQVRVVCEASGALAVDSCPERVEDLAIRGISSQAGCRVHRCIEGDVTENWPTDVAAFLARKGMSAGAATEGHHQAGVERTVRIVSPHTGDAFRWMGQESHSSQQVALLGHSSRSSDTLYWFIDGEFLGEIDAGNPLMWTLKVGTHRALCVGEDGKSDSVTLVVD